ncbi:hypothetical protein MTP03_37860 [Tsukamurella sp. PLM1]|nr:hypothetical protein MTP03_37860 [Tsukamurella sp. PLM1]
MREYASHEEDRLIREPGEGVQIVRGHQDRGTVVGELAQERRDRRLRALVHAGEGLVEEQNARLLRDAAGHERPFALSAGQLPDLPVAVLGELDPFQGPVHRLPVRAARPPREPHPAVPPRHHDVPHRDREAPVHVLRLRHIADGAVAPGPRRRRPVDEDPPGLRLDQPHDGLEQRRFARAVHADEAAHGAAAQGERRAVEGDRVAVAHGDVVDGDGPNRPGRHQGALPVSPVTIVRVSCRSRSR